MKSYSNLLRIFIFCIIAQHSEPLVQRVNSVQVDDKVILHCLEYGESNSRSNVILLLHGFPDLSLSWKYQAEKLADAGYFVVTPDLRGYGSSSIPEGGVVAYGKMQLLSDVNELRRYYCGDDGTFAMIAGHDWGGVIVWSALLSFQSAGAGQLAKCAAILNAPYPATFLEKIYTLRQAFKSWYIFCFQVPFLPEALLWSLGSLYDFVEKELQLLPATIEGNTTDEATCNAHQEILSKDLAAYKDANTNFDRIRATVSYYRAMAAGLWTDSEDLSIVNRLIRFLHSIPSDVPKEPTPASDKAIEIPTLILWGVEDLYLGQELSTPPPGAVRDLEGPIFLDAGHWVHWEKPFETTERLLAFASAHNRNES